jgi:hypothetical protein
MIKAERAAREMSTGLNFVCAWCEHWHRAMDIGSTIGCGKDCGGPASGKGFPLYKGPFKGRLNNYCFICGMEATSGVDIGGRMIGVCNRIGPSRKTCLDKLRDILSGKKGIIVKEIVVPVMERQYD